VAPTIPTLGMAKVLTSLYAIPAAHIHLRGAFTNTVPVDAVRGAGKPETLVLMEGLVDAAARETGRDPVALRRLNLVPADALPYITALGYRYDSGDYAGLLDSVVAQGGEAGFGARRAASAARGLRRGRGFACHVHGSGGWGDESSRVILHPDGRIEALSGTQDQGQGHATAYAQMLAARLGVDAARIVLIQGDSDLVARGGGTAGSSSSIIAGTTLRAAALDAIEQGRTTAAELLEAAPVDLDFADGSYVVAGTDRRIGLFEVVAQAGGLTGRADFAETVESWPAGIARCEVEVDPATGAIAIDRFDIAVDVGRVVNPMLLAGQLQGGLAAGLGQALMEDARYDEAGQMLAATLMDYAMPRAEDLPAFGHAVLSVPTPNNSLGVKGMGELPTNGAPAALANAVIDALANDGVSQIDLPLTAARVWEALRAAS